MRYLPWTDPQFTSLKAFQTSPEAAPHLLQQSKQQQEFVNQWDIATFFESQINDRVNFELAENTVAIFTSILAGLSILFLVEIVFRLVVRHRRGGDVSKYSLYRFHLLQQWSNPLSWITQLTRLYSMRRVIRKQGNGNMLRNQSEERFPWYMNLIICIIGILLVAAELMFIFLATSQSTRYDLDVSSIPSFVIKDEGLNFFIPDPTQGCLTTPVTTKAGFESKSNLQVCGTFNPLSIERSVTDPPGTARVQVEWSSIGLQFFLTYQELTMLYDQYIQIAIQNGTAYRSTFNIRRADCLNALRSTFTRNQLPVLRNTTVGRDTDSSEILYTRAGVVAVLINVTAAPERCQVPGPENMIFCIAGLVRATFHPTGRGIGLVATGGGNDWRLNEVTEPFVLNQRPWLGVIPSIAIVASLAVLFFVLNIVGWEGSIDARWAWKEFFSNTYTIGDFRKGGDEVIHRNWRVDGEGNGILGYDLQQCIHSSASDSG